MITRLIIDISKIGVIPGDGENVVLQKQFLTYQGILMSCGGLIWGTAALLCDREWQSSIPYGYLVITILNMLYFRYSKNFQVTKTVQIVISLLLPFMFQWSLGGFVASGIVMIWALLSLIALVIYEKARTIILWFLLFIALTVFSAIYDDLFIRWIDPENVASYAIPFMVANIVMVSTIIVWLFNFMVRGKNEAMQKLREAQKGLIQSEKMASLGEMTAGIAHEIQNPLNFVNNFSELNRELISEMLQENESGNKEEVRQIAEDISGNEEKINFHGRRADAIVKSMLQHSRASGGEKEPTDINALVDEYLRLAYHGLRAKDKTFNAEFHADLDENVPKINAIPQDIGRVLLNLINNAFYAVSERRKESGEEAYKPRVTVSTRNFGDKIGIRIRDNGTGIPESIRDKIFQPFFSTKPTGSGTGLGLSLAYDIITKVHQGSITVENLDGEGAEFNIVLPINKQG